MSDQFVEAFVDKLILLEQRTGAGVQYRVIPPFTTPFDDHLSIQKVAKEIAASIGLTGFTFVVAVAKQKEKVGGHIDLSIQDTNVFVEIDANMMKFPDAVGATLCHEVCHKWLQIQGIRSPIEIDNEILTDITTVFLGFGKIMLIDPRVVDRIQQLRQSDRRRTEGLFRISQPSPDPVPPTCRDRESTYVRAFALS